MNLIGIAGKAGAGKSTAASVLVKEFGFVEVALSDPLKRICKEVFGFSDDQLWGSSENRNKLDERYPLGGNGIGFLSPRYALQTLGTEWGRRCYEDVWIDIAIRVATTITRSACLGYDQKKGIVEDWRAPMRGVVISDVRFQNEVDAIKKAGGSIWRINRPGAGLEGDHLSEKGGLELGEGDCEINNTGTLKEFRSMVAFRMEDSNG